MPQDINLLPQQGEENKAQVRQSRMLRNGSVAVLAIAIGLVLILGAAKLVLQQQINTVAQDITTQQQHIQSKKDVEGVYVSLNQKLSALGSFFGTQHHYSTVLNEISKAMPASIKLTDLTVITSQEAAITGTAASYPDIAGFYNELRAAGSTNGQTTGGYFETPSLTAIARPDSSGEITFTIKTVLGKALLAKLPGGQP